jgi:hypothetical protein
MLGHFTVELLQLFCAGAREGPEGIAERIEFIVFYT